MLGINTLKIKFQCGYHGSPPLRSKEPHMTKILTIKEANISTLAVELKAIHINSKQMTLSVFRQIQEENCFDENFNLLGLAWGTVNYYWDKCPQDNESVLHIVWQKGDELRRCRFGDIQEERHIISQFTYENKKRLESIERWLAENWVQFFDYIHDEYKLHRPESYHNKEGEQYKKSQELKEKLLVEVPILKSKIISGEEKAKIYIINRRAAYQKIASLPQLYIAA